MAGNINVYDIRKPCLGPLCYDFSLLDKYLAQPDVRARLGVGDRTCGDCCIECCCMHYLMYVWFT